MIEVAVAGGVMLLFLLLGAGGVWWALSYRVRDLQRRLKEAENGLEAMGKLLQEERELGELPTTLDAFRVLLDVPASGRGPALGDSPNGSEPVGLEGRQSDFAGRGPEADSDQS